MVAQWTELGSGDAAIVLQCSHQVAALMLPQIFGYVHNNFAGAFGFSLNMAFALRGMPLAGRQKIDL